MVINDKYLVSICIPTYNGAKYITKCIQSCIIQSYSNIEIIINDDGSTDNTMEVLKELEKKDSRIRINQNQKNLGLVGNWNATLALAKGEYVKWLFQDDWMEPNAIEEFIKWAHKGYDFIISKRNFVLDKNASKADLDYYSEGVKKLEDHFILTEDDCSYFIPKEIAQFATQYIALNFIAEPSLIFFKKDLINRVGLYDNKLQQICDLEYNLRLASVAGVFVINKPLCYFAIHSNSTTNSNITNKYFHLRFIEQAYYAYKVLNNSSFNLLQKALSKSQKLKLAIYYKFRMYEAKKYAIKNNCINLYDQSLANYPELKPSFSDKMLFAPLFAAISLVKSR